MHAAGQGESELRLLVRAVRKGLKDHGRDHAAAIAAAEAVSNDDLAAHLRRI